MKEALQLTAATVRSCYVGAVVHIRLGPNVHVMEANSQNGSVDTAAQLQASSVLGQHTCAMPVMRSGSCVLAA